MILIQGFSRGRIPLEYLDKLGGIMKLNYKKVLIFFIFFAFILSIFIAFQRNRMESDFRQVEMAIGLNKVRELAIKAGIDENELLPELKISGITSIAISEDTIESLLTQGKITYFDTNEMTKLSWLSEDLFLANSTISAGDLLLITQDYSLFQRMKDSFQTYLSQKQVEENLFEDSRYGLNITGDQEELMKLGLGFSEEDIKKVEDFGFKIILRPKNSARVSTEIVQQKILALEQIENISMIIFDDEEVLGYPSSEQLTLTAKFLQENNYPFGIIEFTSQKGIATIASACSKLAVRVHSITKEEMEKITPAKAIERWIRAAQERNVRLFYLHPFLKVREENFVEVNLNYINNIRRELSRSGFSTGKASLFTDYQLPLTYIYILGIGIIAALIILILEFFYFPDRYIFLLFIIGFLLIISINFVAGRILLIKVLALTSALTFPVLAIIKSRKFFSESYSSSLDSNESYSLSPGFYPYKEMVKRIIFGISRIMVISLIGGLLIGALLTHYKFILAIQLFSGIKISYIVPLLLVACYLWWKGKKEKTSLMEELKRPILFEHALLVFIFLVFLVIYISRSGNFSFLPVPAIEEKMRLYLEKILIARPRSKEFLIGYPLLALAGAMNYLGITYLKYVIIIMGTVAPVTVLNTFCHVHTPISFSLLRTFHGYWLGLLFGIILATIFYFAIKFFRKRFHEKRN